MPVVAADEMLPGDHNPHPFPTIGNMSGVAGTDTSGASYHQKEKIMNKTEKHDIKSVEERQRRKPRLVFANDGTPTVQPQLSIPKLPDLYPK